MAKTSRFFFLFTLLLAGSGLLYAQGNLTSALTGTVTSEGAPLPGVTVTVASPNLQGTRTTISGDGGGYSFGALAPGNYTVTFALEGMQTVTKQVSLSVSTAGRADASLGLSGVAEAITVTASAPSVFDTPQIATSFRQEEIDLLPVNRNPLAVAALAPGVLGDQTASGGSATTLSAAQLQISGSPGYDNLILINGVTVTESVRSQAQSLFIEDSIQETTVLTGAISAEFGRFTGGVVNTITKSGGNEFTGSFRDNLTNPKWTEKTQFRDTAGNPEADKIDKLNEQYEATLGGYILRDRLWFFGAGRDQELSEDFATIIPPGSVGTPLPYTRVNADQRWEAKLTGQLGSRHSVVAAYTDKDQFLTNTRFTQNIYDLDSLTTQGTPATLLSAHYNGVLSTNFLLEGQYSERTLAFERSGSYFTDLIQGTLMRDSANGNARFNSPTFCAVCDTETRNNDTWLLKGSYFLSSRMAGNHNLVVGVEDFSEGRFANNHQSGSDFRVNVTRVQLLNGVLYPTIDATSLSYIRWNPIFVGANESDLNTQSAYINDKWDLNQKWSFNLGLRYDKNKTVDGNGNVASDDQAISPRLTAIYDVRGNGRHRVTASYNQYVSRVIDGPASAGSSAGTPAYLDFQYRGPVINAPGTPVDQLIDHRTALAMVFDWFNANGGTDNLALLHPQGLLAIPGLDYRFDGTLKSPSVDEIALGYGAFIGQNAYAKVDLIARDWKDFYAVRVNQGTGQIVDDLGLRHDIGIIENTNDIQREYRAVQFQTRWQPGRFNAGLNYTWSELTGNDETETIVSGAFANQTLQNFYPEFAGYERRLPIGPIEQFDQTHKARLFAGYDIPLPERIGSLNVSALQYFDSGIAYSGDALINVTGAGSYAGSPTIPAYARSLLGGTANYYFSDRGEFRTDDITRSDFSLNYSLPIWAVELFAQADLLNAFDESGLQDVQNINTTVLTSRNAACLQGSGGVTPGARCITFNPFTQRAVEGTHFQYSPTFGRANNFLAYQLGRTYRFSAGIRF